MKFAKRVAILVAFATPLIAALTAYAQSTGPSDKLATPESFAGIGDTAARSAALFTEHSAKC